VVMVIGGWFFTAFCAFTSAFLLAFLINWGGAAVIFALLLLAAYVLYRSFRLHRKRDSELKAQSVGHEEEVVNGDNVLKSCTKSVYKTLSSIAILYTNSISGLIEHKRKSIKLNLGEIKQLNKEVKILKNNLYKTISRLQEDEFESGHHYVQVLDYLRETAHCLTFIAEPVFTYIDNNHPPLIKDQKQELNELADQVNAFFSSVIQSIKNSDYEQIGRISETQQELLESLTKLKKKQLKRIKRRDTGTRNSELFLNTLNESKNLLLYSVNLLKAQRDFVRHNARPLLEEKLSESRG
jgi:Na+/phosphate symporter